MLRLLLYGAAQGCSSGCAAAEQHRQRPYQRGRAEPQPGAERVCRRCAQHGTGHGDLRHMPGRLPHCRCLNSSLLRPNGAANGRRIIGSSRRFLSLWHQPSSRPAEIIPVPHGRSPSRVPSQLSGFVLTNTAVGPSAPPIMPMVLLACAPLACTRSFSWFQNWLTIFPAFHLLFGRCMVLVWLATL